MTLGLSVQISETGISAPDFDDVLTGFQNKTKEIFGSDIYIEPDSQDGQLLVAVAQALHDCNDAAIAAYNAFRPSGAVGVGLSSTVKVNGIERLVASNSTAPGTVVGQVGKVITNGQVRDANNNIWNLPASVLIPPAGQINVTVTAAEKGAILAPSGTINKIVNPVVGWQSFVSTADATPGEPVESDPTLRKRQAVSTQKNANAVPSALKGALSNLPGVQRVAVYENDTASVDANGIPANSVCVVIEGGDLTQIAQTIGQKKTQGIPTYGTTSQPYINPTTGIPYTIKFFLLAIDTIKIVVSGSALLGYTSAQAGAIKQAFVDYIGAHEIGEDIEYTGLGQPAYQGQPARVMPYRINSITCAIGAGAQGTADLVIPFNAIARSALTDITVTIV